jgi:hypothetical protein
MHEKTGIDLQWERWQVRKAGRTDSRKTLNLDVQSTWSRIVLTGRPLASLVKRIHRPSAHNRTDKQQNKDGGGKHGSNDSHHHSLQRS